MSNGTLNIFTALNIDHKRLQMIAFLNLHFTPSQFLEIMDCMFHSFVTLDVQHGGFWPRLYLVEILKFANTCQNDTTGYMQRF